MFSDAAQRLAGLAGALLGWTPDLFWQATPAELLGVLRAMNGEGESKAGCGADMLRALMERFPD